MVTVMAHAGLFLMVYPYTKWITSATVLQLHSGLIAANLIPPSAKTENIAKAIADMQDIGWFKFE